ncbi:MAG: ABC transporter permease [Anaerolineae bacterium]|nr:ABC transporter permease [Anaerolineae bacterium]
MRKILNVAWKDLVTTFRDPTALIIMLAAPYALTLVMAFAFGGLSGGGGGLSGIPVFVVNHDSGEFGGYLQQTFQSPDLADLLDVTVTADEAAARAAVDANKAAAAVVIPANLSDSIVPPGLASGNPSALANRPQAVVEVYANPDRPISAGIVRGIVDQFLSRVSAGAAGGQVAVSQLIASGLLAPQEALTKGMEIGERAARQATETRLIALKGETAAQDPRASFDWLTYMAPSMAILFLMFTVSNGGKTLLAERDWGTLPRLLTTPTSTFQVLGGKVCGIYLTGLAQMGILLVASRFMLGVKHGPFSAVVPVTLALVAAATGWALVLAAYARTAGQANQMGTILSLAFGGLAGNFFPRQALPEWIRTVSLITPNAWGLDAFNKLTAGGTLGDVLVPIVGLLAMAAVLFVAASVIFRRQYA